MLSVLLNTTANLTETDGFSVLLWGVGIVVPALVTAIGILWNAKVKADKDHKSEITAINSAHAIELKTERDYIKQEGKEQSAILHGLSSILNDLSRGIEKDIPKDIESVKALIDSRSNEIKDHINSRNNGT